VLKIGLTGGVGSGKSTVAKCFAELGVPIIDADEIAHELFENNPLIYNKIISHFGVHVLTQDKYLDRKKISNIIFCDKKERLWLEELMHPVIRDEMLKRAELFNKEPYCIMVIPLLFETKFPPKLDRILLVDCTKEIQISRVANRDHHDIEKIEAIMGAQIDRNNRFKHADDIIDNVSSLAALKENVRKLHNYYLSLI
jgi:dephospho-CoA kinase